MNPVVVPALSIVGALAAFGTVMVTLIGAVRRPEPEKYRQIWLKMSLQVLFLLVFIGVGALGRYAMVPVVVFIAFRCWYELLRALETKYGAIAKRGLLIVLGSLVPIAGLTGSAGAVILAAFAATWVAMALPILVTRRPAPLHGLGFSAFAMCFISIPLGLLLIMAADDYGAYAFCILLLMAHDGLAEGFGRLLGRRPLWPDISPGKTLGGTLGGIASCLVLGYALRFMVPAWDVPEALAVSAIIVMMAATGDLIASAMKREAGIKDFGSILPAHGGVLDRVDSLLFTVPVFFAAARFLGGQAG
jgi:CDP-diglyceride synthetase